MEAILVTGGAGFIGSCFVRRRLDTCQTPLVVVDKLTYAGHRASLDSAANRDCLHFQQLDIVDGKTILELLQHYRPRAIIHFAAESHVDRSIREPAPFVMTNVVGTCHLLEAARRYWSALAETDQAAFRFLHVSTDEVYGSLGESGRFAESSPYAPNSPYAASKAAGDHFARAYHRTYGLPVIITNSSNNFGPYQHPEKLIPRMTLHALAGIPLPVYGDGMQVRDWLFVEEHCRALELLLDRGRPGEVYNLGGNCERTNLDVVRAVCAIVDRLAPAGAQPRESLIQFVPDRLGHDRRYAIDASKMEREMGWRCQQDFNAALERTVRWYLENPQWVRQVEEHGA